MPKHADKSQLIKALQACLECMEIQERRESEEFHIPQKTFWPMWQKAKRLARSALAPENKVTTWFPEKNK